MNQYKVLSMQGRLLELIETAKLVSDFRETPGQNLENDQLLVHLRALSAKLRIVAEDVDQLIVPKEPVIERQRAFLKRDRSESDNR